MTNAGVVAGDPSDSTPERDHPVVAVRNEFDGFDVWYAAAWPRLQRIMRAYCGSKSTADDVAAEACLRVAERWTDPRRRPHNPDAWATTVAFNLIKRQRHRARLEESARATAVPNHTTHERDLDIGNAMRRLPPRMRQAVVLRYVGDFTEAAVAEAMGTSTGYVSSTLSEARRRIKRDNNIIPKPDTDRT